VTIERVPKFPMPLAATLVTLATFTGFALALTAVVFSASPVEQPWPAAAGLFYLLAALSGWGLVHALGTRHAFRSCRLHLQPAMVAPDETTSFTLADPRRRLVSARALEITLAWRERSRRVGGRKVYTEGPYDLSSRVSWEQRDSLPSAGGGPGLVGTFRVARKEIKLKQLDEWTQQVEVLVRVRTGSWRACYFVLPVRWE
jgi:hypothetical protein